MGKPLTYLLISLMCSASACSVSSQQADRSAPTAYQNNLSFAQAWKQTAAEYQALYFQGFNMATLRLELALANRSPADKPLAVISDLDETLLNAHDYWAYLIAQNQDFFDDASWDQWIAQHLVTASPGALELLQFCERNGVEVFYVTNRDQGETTYSLALESLRQLNFPYADNEHLTVLRDTSNKQSVQDRIRADFNVVVMLGDNLNDFSRKYYVTDVATRKDLAQTDQSRFGSDYIVFPNPTDGHWIRAVFGDSEPPPTVENRAILQRAATGQL